MSVFLKTLRLCLRAVPALLAGLAAAGCAQLSQLSQYAQLPQFARVPPGNSVEVALARPATVVKFPDARKPVKVKESVDFAVTGPELEPELPTMDMNDVPTNGVVMEDVAAYVARGDALMQEGKTEEAIAAYKEAIRVDPTFSVTWRNLAVAYEAAGDSARAMEAFRQYKQYASH